MKAADKSNMYVLSVTTTPRAFVRTARLAAGCQRIKTALGLHPEIAHERESELPLFDRLISETRYVGEVGLDGATVSAEHYESQKRVFSHILRKCAEADGKILTIHSRRAATDVLDALDRQPGYGKAVLHWFTGSQRELERAITSGCWFSVGSPMLRSDKGRTIVSRIPRDRLLTETDAPFTSKRGEEYSASHVSRAVEGIAALWKTEPTEIGRIVTDNLRRLLG